MRDARREAVLLSEADAALAEAFARGMPIRVVAARAGVATSHVCDAVRRARRAGLIADLARAS